MLVVKSFVVVAICRYVCGSNLKFFALTLGRGGGRKLVRSSKIDANFIPS